MRDGLDRRGRGRLPLTGGFFLRPAASGRGGKIRERLPALSILSPPPGVLNGRGGGPRGVSLFSTPSVSLPAVREIAILDAPSNLGLRPPGPGLVPGVYKLGWALRSASLPLRLGAREAGVVLPPRYDPETDGHTPRNLDALVRYSRMLADRVGPLVEAGSFALILGGDCSILIGTMLALRRRGRYGLAFLDGHLDFRHPGNSPSVGAAAGEDLALVTGRGPRELTHLEDRGPLVLAKDVVALGSRPDDEYRGEVEGCGVEVVDVPGLRREGTRSAGDRVAAGLLARGVSGFFVHLDVDLLDPTVMPAVDAPAPGGLTFEELSDLLRPLVASPGAVGLEVTVFDPDLDEDGRLARQLADALVRALG